jgi:glucose/mannose transport system substrate-binding protein
MGTTIRSFLLVLTVLLVSASLAFAGGSGEEEEAANELEIFSWWTAGGEAEGLQALIDLYTEQYPDVEVINATVAGGAGTNAKAVLATRMQGGNPPDTFQVHAGRELIDTWVVSDFMEPVTYILEDNGWMDVYPPEVIDIISYQGEVYSIPVNVHRSNVMWYNIEIFEEHGLEPPETVSDFFDVAEELQSAGVTPLALGDTNVWPATHLMESALVAGLGPDGYNGLWNGETRWDSQEVKTALSAFVDMLEYINDDHSALTNIDAAGYVADGKAAMTVMGDWVHGYYLSRNLAPNEDYGYAPTPGTNGVFIMLSDSFGLPQGAPHPTNVERWLELIGSREGQDAFNPIKGSIPARTDADRSLYDEYLLSSMDDFSSNDIVPSVAHGSAASESWLTSINDIVNVFVTERDVDQAAADFQRAADEALR